MRNVCHSKGTFSHLRIRPRLLCRSVLKCNKASIGYYWSQVRKVSTTVYTIFTFLVERYTIRSLKVVSSVKQSLALKSNIFLPTLPSNIIFTLGLDWLLKIALLVLVVLNSAPRQPPLTDKNLRQTLLLVVSSLFISYTQQVHKFRMTKHTQK